MPSLFKLGSTIVGLALLYQEVAAQSGSGKTTRYWDCCKPSCAWSKKASVSHPVTTCDKNNNPLSNYDTKSACDSGGTAYTCANNAPIVINDSLAYGFAAVNIAGSNEAGWCCQCYELTFTSGPVQGQKLVVQATNTGGDLGSNQFDLLIPGGGVGLFNGCTSQYGSWNGGAQYGGVSSESQCSSLPTSAMQTGCKFRFQWFKGADNPSVNWKAVGCPKELTNISGCVRNGDAGYTPPASNPATTTTTGSGSTQTGGGGGGTVAQYGQCGGANYSGATECVAGTTCTKVNDFYYQCL